VEKKNRQPNTGSTCIGTDINRNYLTGWGGAGASSNPCDDTYRGPRAQSTPELIGMQTWLTQNVAPGSLISFIDIHAYGGMWMSPWGYTTASPPDYAQMSPKMMTAVSAIRTAGGPSYTWGPVATTIYVASGGSNDWYYGEKRVIQAFAIETNGTSFTPPVATIKPTASTFYAGLKAVALTL